MARLFVDESSQYLEIDQAVLGTKPLAFAAWVYSDEDTTQRVLCQGDKDTALDRIELALYSNVPAGHNSVGAYELGTVAGYATSTTDWSLNTWHHACALFVASADRRAILDGAGKGTETTAITVTDLDRTTIGATAFSTRTNYFSGRIAEAAIWDLSGWPGATASDKADEFERSALLGLAARFSPLFFPLGLVAYWPLGGIYAASDGDYDIVGGYHMTPYNSPTTADHLSILTPGGHHVFAAVAAGPIVTEDTFQNASPFEQDESIGTCEVTGGQSPYSWEILSQTLN